MGSEMCIRDRDTFSQLPGVTDVRFDEGTGTAKLSYDATEFTPSEHVGTMLGRYEVTLKKE